MNVVYERKAQGVMNVKHFSRASGEAVFSGVKLKWLSAFKMDKMFTRGRLSIHLQEAPKLPKEWGEGNYSNKFPINVHKYLHRL